MDFSDYYQQPGEGELSINGRRICGVNYHLRKDYWVGVTNKGQTSKPQPRFIGELLLLTANGESRQVYDAALRNTPFTLVLEDNRQLQVLLLPDAPDIGVFEILVLDS